MKALYTLFLSLACLNLFAQEPAEIDQFVLSENVVVQVKSWTFNGMPELDIRVIDQSNEQNPYLLNADTIPGFDVGQVFEAEMKMLGKDSVLLLHHHTGGEGIIPYRLLYLSMIEGELHHGVLHFACSYEWKDLNFDPIPELIYTDHPYCRLNAKGCEESRLDPYYEGNLDVEFFQWKNGHFQKLVANDYQHCVVPYIRFVEEKIEKRKEAKVESTDSGILDYAHYFYICAQSGLEKRAFRFIEFHNQPYTSKCDTSQTTLLDFMRTHKEQLLQH